MSTYLKSVRLTNCQSYDDEIIDFSQDKVNVFVAENQTGKSVFYKMLKISVCPKLFDKEDRLNLIRRGKTFAQIMFCFSDGSYAATRVYDKTVIFYFTDDKNKAFRTSNSPFQETIDRLSILIDTQNNFIANVIESEQDLMLVNSSAKSNSTIMQMFTESQSLESLLTEVDKRYDTYTQRLSSSEERLTGIKNQMNDVQYVDIEEYSRTTERSEFLFEKLYELYDIYRCVSVVSEIVTYKRDYEFMINVCIALEKICFMLTESKRIVIPIEDKSELLGIVGSLEKIEKLKLLTQYHCVEDIPFDKFLKVCNTVNGLATTLSSIKTIQIPKNVDYRLKLTIVELIEPLNDLATNFKALLNSITLIQKCSIEEESLIKLLRESNLIISCPLYGEVVFDSEKCLPINN